MNTSTTSKQLSTTNIAAPTTGTREENTTKATNLSSLVTSANSSSASPQLANNFGTTSQVRPSGLIGKLYFLTFIIYMLFTISLNYTSVYTLEIL